MRIGFSSAQIIPMPSARTAMAELSVTQPALPAVQTDRIMFRGTEKAAPVLSRAEQQDANRLAREYIKFLQSADSDIWTAKTIIEEAERRGFREMPEKGPVNGKLGDKFYIRNEYGSVALIVLGFNNPLESGFNITAAHTDSPHLVVKPEPLLNRGGLIKLKTKIHGGLTGMTWFNKSMKLTGRVFEAVLDNKGEPKRDLQTRLPLLKERWVKSRQSIGMLTIEPPHLNRAINQGREIKPEYDYAAVIGHNGQPVSMESLKKVGVDLTNAVSADLRLVPAEKPAISGVNRDFIEGAGHDDRALCFATMEGIFRASEESPMKTSIAFFFNNEEVGSLNRAGARSRFLEHVAGRVLRGRRNTVSTDINYYRELALKKSFIFSADAAHAFDPDKAQLHDRDNPMLMGYGPVIKEDQNGHYTTTPDGTAITRLLARRAGVPVQTLSTNQNVSCGTTIGPFIAAQTMANTVDIGIPVLSMHASREMIAKNDLYFATRLFASFFKND